MLAGTEGLAKARKAQTGFFESQQKALEEAFRAERAAMIELELSRRDLDVVAILDQKPSDDPTPDAVAWTKIDERLKAIEKSIDVGTIDGLKSPGVHDVIARQRQLQMRITRNIHTSESTLRAYQQNGGSGQLGCNDDGSTSPPTMPSGLSDDGRGAFASFSIMCTERQGLVGELKSLRAAQPAWLAVTLGIANLTNELQGGDLKEDAAEAANLRELLNAQLQLTARADKHYLELRQYLQCLQQQKPQTLEQQIAGAAQQLAEFLEWLAKIDTIEGPPASAPNEGEKAKEVTQTCTSTQTGPTTRPTKVESLRQLAGEEGPQPGRIQELLTTVGQFAPARSLFASLQAEAQEIRESELHTILTAIAGSTSDTIPEDRRAEIAVRSIKLVSLIAELKAGRAPSTSAVLIDIADAQLKANNARIEGERLAELSRLADLRLAALRSELTALVGGIDAVVRHRAPRLPTFLRAYNEGWVHGRLQRSLIEADMLNQEYIAWLHRQRVTADAVYAMLEPAFTELKVHADGGFTPQEIATYLQTLGIGAIAVGTN